MHEIISLQLGQRSNYLGTHFWNLQESYFTYNREEESLVDHDVHFRPGIGVDGAETFTPRTLIYDLKGGFGALRKYNALYELEEQASLPKSLWDGNEVVQRQPTILQSEYQTFLDAQLTPPPLTPETVRYWSDFNRVFYHPRSIVQLNDYELNSSLMPFDDWSVGGDLFSNLDKEQDLLDRDIRPFSEECDHIRAFQIFTSSDDAWGGFVSKYVERLRDEYGKVGIWVWALEDSVKVHQQRKRALLQINVARTLHAASPQSSIYCPILDPPCSIPPYLSMNPQSEWYTSALIASAVETATLPSRLRPYYDFESSLMGEGGGIQKIYELQSGIIGDQFSDPKKQVPPANRGGNEARVDLTVGFDINFTFHDPARGNPRLFNQVHIIRGLESQMNCEDIQDETETNSRLRLDKSDPRVERLYTPLRFPILDSYPQNLFPCSIRDGGIRIHAALSTTSRLGDRIKRLQEISGKAVGVDERETLLNGLGEILEAYEDGWVDDSESGDD